MGIEKNGPALRLAHLFILDVLMPGF